MDGDEIDGDEIDEDEILREKDSESMDVIREIKNNLIVGDIHNTTKKDFITTVRNMLAAAEEAVGKYDKAAVSADIFTYLTYPGPLGILKNALPDSSMERLVKTVKEKIIELKEEQVVQTNGSFTHFKKLNDELNLGIDFD